MSVGRIVVGLFAAVCLGWTSVQVVEVFRCWNIATDIRQSRFSSAYEKMSRLDMHSSQSRYELLRQAGKNRQFVERVFGNWDTLDHPKPSWAEGLLRRGVNRGWLSEEEVEQKFESRRVGETDPTGANRDHRSEDA